MGVKVTDTQNVAQYPLHHVTSVPAKIEVAASISLDDTITKRMTNGNYFGAKLINFNGKGKKKGYKIFCTNGSWCD